MCELLVGTEAVARFLKAPSLCLISFPIVWLGEMSLYFAFDFRPGLITPPLSLSVRAYLSSPAGLPLLPQMLSSRLKGEWSQAFKRRH